MSFGMHGAQMQQRNCYNLFVIACWSVQKVQRNNAAVRVAAERALDRATVKKARKEQDDEELRVRRIRADIGETSLIKSRNDLVATQLEL